MGEWTRAWKLLNYAGLYKEYIGIMEKNMETTEL